MAEERSGGAVALLLRSAVPVFRKPRLSLLEGVLEVVLHIDAPHSPYATTADLDGLELAGG